MRRRWGLLLILTMLMALLTPVSGLAGDTGTAASGATDTNLAADSGPRPEVRYATRTDTSGSLRQTRPFPPVLGEIFEARPRKLLPNRADGGGTSGPDTAVQASAGGPSAPTTSTNFEGINNVNGVLPPDTVGDIGPNHYVQMVNLSFAIWDRSGNLLYGPANSNTLWSGFGGPCETTNDGDPIVLYDEAANRWMMSQFALPSFPRGPFYECIAVSQTGDPLGAWHRYEFTISKDKLNDYPKFGVWPDGYYMAVNQFKCNFVRCSWGGQGVVAFERDAMLTGAPARMVYFDLYNQDANLGGMLPSDLDGPAPPAGAPNYFAQVDDDAWGYSPDQLQIWEFHVDWSNPANSTFTRATTLGTSSFDANMCGYSRNCIPQPGGNKLDAISDRLMYRFQYRNFGTHQTLVVNHTVDANGSDRAGIRWYELRNAGSGWSIRQQSTFSPDSTHRWMGSIAMNSAGDIALGYSVSSTSLSPSIRVTGRLGADTTLNAMTQGEATIISGSGYQQHTSGRWGDYSMMAVDPTDDCTFWYTQEYYNSIGSAPWQTRIGSFRLSDCTAGGGDPNNPPAASIVSPANGAVVSGAVTVQVSASDTEDAAGTLTVEWNLDGGSWLTAAYNAGTGYYEATWDTTAAAEGGHTVNARATDSQGAQAGDSNSVTVDNIEDTSTMHVGDLDRAAVNNGGTWTAQVTITVHDGEEGPVSGATVSGSWSNGATGTASCTTDATGTCMVSKSGIAKRTGSVTFSVTGVTHSTLNYSSAANHDPDGDSNGTSITVLKP